MWLHDFVLCKGIGVKEMSDVWGSKLEREWAHLFCTIIHILFTECKWQQGPRPMDIFPQIHLVTIDIFDCLNWMMLLTSSKYAMKHPTVHRTVFQNKQCQWCQGWETLLWGWQSSNNIEQAQIPGWLKRIVLSCLPEHYPGPLLKLHRSFYYAESEKCEFMCYQNPTNQKRRPNNTNFQCISHLEHLHM